MKYFNHIILIICCGLSACNIGNGSGGKSSSNAGEVSVKTSEQNLNFNNAKDELFKRVDIYDLKSTDEEVQSNSRQARLLQVNMPNCVGLDGDVAGQDICFSNSAIDAQYGSGIGNQQYWSKHEFGFNLRVTFNVDSVTNFRLSDVYSILTENQILPNGRISQVVTDECDKLVTNGQSLIGQTCAIHLIYTGDAPDTNQNINFVFKWGDHSYTYPILFQNLKFANSNVPIINLKQEGIDDILPLYALIDENASNNALAYTTDIGQIYLINHGTGNIAGKPMTPTIGVNLSNKTTSYDFDKMYSLNSYYTECDDKEMQSGGSCLFKFRLYPNKDSGYLDSQTGVFDFNYKIGSEIQHYIKRFYVSVGDFLPTSVNLTPNPAYQDSFVFTINKAIVGSGSSIMYSTRLIDTPNIPEGVRFSVVVQPQFNTAFNLHDKRVDYSVGDYTGVDGFKFSPEEFFKNLKFSYDKDCLMTGFNPRYEDGINGHHCPVKVNFDSKYAQNKPLSGLLMMEYWSPVDNIIVHQIIGPITINTGNMKPFTPRIKTDTGWSNEFELEGDTSNPLDARNIFIYGSHQGKDGKRWGLTAISINLSMCDEPYDLVFIPAYNSIKAGVACKSASKLGIAPNSPLAQSGVYAVCLANGHCALYAMTGSARINDNAREAPLNWPGYFDWTNKDSYREFNNVDELRNYLRDKDPINVFGNIIEKGDVWVHNKRGLLYNGDQLDFSGDAHPTDLRLYGNPNNIHTCWLYWKVSSLLLTGNAFLSTGGNHAVMGRDGNLVLRGDNDERWSTANNGAPKVDNAVMHLYQDTNDGNKCKLEIIRGNRRYAHTTGKNWDIADNDYITPEPAN
jgi:hypothetical protein